MAVVPVNKEPNQLRENNESSVEHNVIGFEEHGGCWIAGDKVVVPRPKTELGLTESSDSIDDGRRCIVDWCGKGRSQGKHGAIYSH